MLAEADVIWCEWWLGNAVWYSWNKRPEQKLIVRLHLFELTREYGLLTRPGAVDRAVAVSLPMMIRMRARFALPPSRCVAIPDGVDFAEFEDQDVARDEHGLALVGAVPSRKGLWEALDVLEALRNEDPGYHLDIFGQNPENLPWVWRDPAQREYYGRCAERIAARGMSDAVVWRGWADMRKELRRAAFVLAPSRFESFHVAPVEAAAAGAVPLVWPWRGRDWIHPASAAVSGAAEAVRRIQDLADAEARRNEAESIRRWYMARYSASAVADAVTEGMR